MDWILKKMADFFKFWWYVFQKSARNLLWLALSKKIHLWYLRRSFTEAFCLCIKPYEVMILAQNWPKTAKFSWHCSFKGAFDVISYHGNVQGPQKRPLNLSFWKLCEKLIQLPTVSISFLESSLNSLKCLWSKKIIAAYLKGFSK